MKLTPEDDSLYDGTIKLYPELDKNSELYKILSSYQMKKPEIIKYVRINDKQDRTFFNEFHENEDPELKEYINEIIRNAKSAYEQLDNKNILNRLSKIDVLMRDNRWSEAFYTLGDVTPYVYYTEIDMGVPYYDEMIHQRQYGTYAGDTPDHSLGIKFLKE